MKPLLRSGWKPPPIARSSTIPRVLPKNPLISVAAHVNTNTSRLFAPIKPFQQHLRRNNTFAFSPLLNKEKNPDHVKFLEEFAKHLQTDKMEEANSMFDAMVKHDEHHILLSTEITEAYLAKLAKHKMV